jgi:acetoin utilization deacetylase AcuC-like enzyme
VAGAEAARTRQIAQPDARDRGINHLMIELVSHADFARLHPTGRHPESGQRIRVLHDHLGGWIEPVPATRLDIERCHDPALVELIRTTTEPRLLDLDTVCTETSYEAALLAAGGAIEAARVGGFALVRPPGHHATRMQAMGFCLFNNIAIAARFVQTELGVGRVAILDWYVHHGNGTEDIFRDDQSVFYVSIHQWPLYPGTGGPDEQGETLLNVPLPAGSTDEDYLRVFDEVVEPAVTAFEPDLVLVSAGFDAHAEDPLAEMLVTQAGFLELARRSAALGSSFGAVLEGGYNLETLPALVGAALEGFSS